MKNRFLAILALLLLSQVCAEAAVGSAEEDAAVAVSIHPQLYNANYPDAPATRRIRELLKADRSLAVSMWGGIELPGGSGKASTIMAIAGRTAPDILFSHFHVIRNDIDQGFLYPLNEWIGNDRNGDGQIDDHEAAWPGWRSIPRLWQRVATVDGKIYGLPQASTAYMGVIFRTDLVQAAGLDPESPPGTWDELIYWCQRLTDPGKQFPGATYQRGQRGIVLLPYGFTWLPWVQAKHFGGLGIHCCADARHQWGNFRALPGLKLINHCVPPTRAPGEYIPDSLRFYGATVAQMPLGWTPTGPPESWPSQYPDGARVVFEVQAEDADRAASTPARLRECLHA